MPEYMVTKEECESKITGVCEGCGGKLSAMETVDNARNPTFWQGCEYCRCFRMGIEPVYFKIARKLVEAGEILLYSHMQKRNYMDSGEMAAYFYACQTAALSLHIKRIHGLIVEICSGKE